MINPSVLPNFIFKILQFIRSFQDLKRLSYYFGLQLILMNQNVDPTSNISSPIKSEGRSSCSTALSQDLSEIQDRMIALDFELKNLNAEAYFQPEITQPEINTKLHKKAIHAIFSICWDRNIDEDCLWTSLMIYYSYKAKKVIKRNQLEKIVSVCILLSCKLLKPEKLCMKKIIQITNGKHSSKSIAQTQAQILNTLGFDLFIENFLKSIVWSNKLNSYEKEEFQCLSEMLMANNSDIFWKKSISGSLLKFIKGVSCQNITQIKKSILDLSKTSQGELVLRKYSSKLDTQKLIKKVHNC